MQNLTPSQIDTQLAPIYNRYAQAAAEKAEALSKAAKYAKHGTRFASSVKRFEEEAAEAQTEMDAADAEMAPFEAEYTRRGGWSRFFMVMNNGGHLHRSRSCSTCRWSTQFAWMPEYSGANEAEIVDLAGEDACTVCFPSAPVEKQSRLPFRVAEREEAAKAAAEKAAKKSAANAAQIVVGRKVYKTLRAAENEMSWKMDGVVSRSHMEGVDAEHTAQLRGLAAEDRAELETLADATQAVYPEWDRAGVLAKKFATKAKEYRKAGLSIPTDASY